jgi:hypothetical protein
MRLKGRRPGVHIEPIVLPRPDEDLVFHAKAIENFDEFDKLCPIPEPPAKILPSGQNVPNANDANFLKAMEGYGGKRVAYMVIKGLTEGTPDLEWETVELSNHFTWDKYRKELQESGLSDIEINRLVAGVMKANSLSEHAVDEAMKRFLAGQAVQREELSSQKGEQLNTLSGVPASELA